MITEYYDGAKLLSMQDLDGNRPELYLCTTNRTGGKTTYFSRLLINAWKRRQKKFALFYRFNYELDDISDKFFKDIRGLFFPGDNMISKPRAKGIYHDLYLNDEHCGYAISLNSADQINFRTFHPVSWMNSRAKTITTRRMKSESFNRSIRPSREARESRFDMFRFICARILFRF